MTVQDDDGDNMNLMTETSCRFRTNNLNNKGQQQLPSASGKRTLNGSSLPACNRRLSNDLDVRADRGVIGNGENTVKSSSDYASPIEVSNLSAY